jgi:endonuclease V-like protein UPF0215 family
LTIPQDAFRSLPVVGVEDGSFQKGVTFQALLAAVLFRDLHIEDLKITKVTVDGLDATKRLIEILSFWKFEAVFLAGVSFAGFNMIDPAVIHRKFGKPVIIITRTKPDNKAVKRALKKHFEDWKVRFEVFEKLGLPYDFVVFSSRSLVYVKTVGASAEWACNLVKALSILGKVPEPIRVARLIARGLS